MENKEENPALSNKYRHNGGRGPSSYHMHDPCVIFYTLNLREGDVFLDLGCGMGEYSIQASKMVGNAGKVYAIDKGETTIKNLLDRVKLQGINNISVMLSDICQPLEIEDNVVDVCFITTVLHCLNIPKVSVNLFKEVHRVLKSKGRLIIIECNKTDTSRGPPLHMRISPVELLELVIPQNFKKLSFMDLGFNYLMEFGIE